MSFWTAAVIIVLIVSVTRLMRSRRRDYRRRDDAAPESLAASQREAEMAEEIRALKERIHVLERIATDDRKSIGLAEEIENLRDR